MNDHKIQWLDTEYPTVMDDIDRLIEANNGDFRAAMRPRNCPRKPMRSWIASRISGA